MTQNCFKFNLKHWGRRFEYGLTYRGRVTHIWGSKLCHHWLWYWLVACSARSHYLLLVVPLPINFIEIQINVEQLSIVKRHLKMSFAKRQPFCVGLSTVKIARITTVQWYFYLEFILYDELTQWSLYWPLSSWIILTDIKDIFAFSIMMTSSNGNMFRVTGHLCGEFTGPRWIPHTKASYAELWCFLWYASK